MSGGPAKGAMFWQWYDEGQRAPAEEGGTVNGLFGAHAARLMLEPTRACPAAYVAYVAYQT